MTLSHSPNIVRDGLVLYLDAANPKSYPGSGTTWYDLSGNNANALAENMPTFVSNGSKSYFDFNGIDHEFRSEDVSQEYRDLFALINLSSTAPTLSMLFGKYDNQDDSLRFQYNKIRSSPDLNDWQYLNTEDVFLNGEFDQSGIDISDSWSFIRSYRENDIGFGNSFRYEISSSFYSRHFKGYLATIFCYNRKLSNDEVRQNFNALRGRYGI